MSTKTPPFRPLPSYLPHPHPTAPYWRTSLHRLDRHRSTSALPVSCDTLIIGTGLTGVSTAYHLLQHPNAGNPVSTDKPLPSAHPSILLLEARGACSGATGRNGGHLKPSFMTLSKLRETLGKEGAEEIKAFVLAQIDALEQVVRKENIDCEFRRNQTWDILLEEDAAVTKAAEWKECKREGWDALGGLEGFIRKEYGGDLTAEEVEEACQVKNVKVAFRAPAGMLWPYKLTMGLLERCLEMGAQMQTETTVLELMEEDGGWLVRTDRGDVRCRRVVSATNGYTAGILPEYEGIIRPIKGINSIMEKPANDKRADTLLKDSYNLHYGPGLASYIVPQPSGSTIVGGAIGIHREVARERYDNVDDSTLVTGAESMDDNKWGLRNVLPMWMKGCEDMNKGRIWSGIMGYTPDDHPHIGQVPGRQGVYIAAGFNGRGMLQIFLATKGLVQMTEDGQSLVESRIPACFQASAKRMKRWD